MKRKKIVNLFSMLVMLVFLLASFFIPVSKETANFAAQADGNGTTPIYAFASAYGKGGNGKFYVDIGISLDMLSDEKITRDDATLTTQARLKSFESATIYYRTRNMSAIAEQGDYEAVDGSVTVLWNSPYKTMTVYVNGGSGLQIGTATREFYFEIYKVEINGVQEGYKFVQPNESPKQSIQAFSITPELSLKKTGAKAVDGGTLEFMDEFQYLESYLPSNRVRDIEYTSYLDSARVNLAKFGDDWYRKLKYLSDNDILKLGVQVTGEVEQTSYAWLYVDDAYVGIQLFVGNPSTLSAPALPNMSEDDMRVDPYAQEYAIWYIKMESQKKESLTISNSFNGTLEGVTVSSKFSDKVLLANAVYNKKHGAGGFYDENTGVVDKNILVIDDFDGLLKGEEVLSARGWSYMSDEVLEFVDFYVNYVPVNYRAKMQSTTLGSLRYDENGKAKIGLSVRFNEPMQLKKNTGNDKVPCIEAAANGFSGAPLNFVYTAGDGTDTFYFEADVSDLETKITSVKLNTAKYFDLVYDFSPWTEDILGGNQALNMMATSTVVNGFAELAEERLSCSYDLRNPSLKSGSKTSTMKKTSHSVTIQTENISETGMLYYGWVSDDTSVPSNLSSSPISAQGYQTVYSPPNISGTRYLYAIAVSEIDKKSEPIWIGPFYFDNDAPTISAQCIVDAYQQKEFKVTITNKSAGIEAFTEYANLKKAVSVIVSSDYAGNNVIKTFSIPLADSVINQEETEFTFHLQAAALGLEEGSDLEYGTYYVSFSACDVLENQSKSEPVAYYFDVRKILRVSPLKLASDPDYEMDEFKSGGALYGALEESYYTLDLSKMDSAQDFFFKFKVDGAEADDASINLQVSSFESVKTGESFLAYIEDESSNSLGKVKIVEKFEPGLYCLIFADAKSEKMSLPIYFYVTNGKDAETGRYAEETGVYQSISGGTALTNTVFQIPTTIYYHYRTDAGTLVKESYSATNKPATFSSWTEVYTYVLYREYLDMYAVTLSQDFADNLNSGIYRKASGDLGITARAGQVWIRYKNENWRPNGTASEWVYYYYSENNSSLPINPVAISGNLMMALATVAGSISEHAEYVNLVTQEYLDSYGAPFISEGQMHLNPESRSESMSGTPYAEPIDYLGDSDMYLSLDLNAPLSTNAKISVGKNSRLFYKTDASGYHELILDERKTLGEYFNATDKFMIFELDENGAREYSVYIDKSAPTVRISWLGQGGLQEKDFTAADNNQTISGSNFYIESMDDYDVYSFVSIYRYTGQGEGELLSVHRKYEFDSGMGVRLEDGKYHVHISDRSGNDYSFVVQVKSDPLVCTVKEVANSYIQIDINREESEVRYQVYYYGWIYTTEYEMKKFTDSGEYRFLVEDIYGNVYDRTFTFERALPVVEWSYQSSDNRFVAYDGSQDEMSIRQIDEQNYAISTSTRLRFTLNDGCAYQIMSGTPSLTPNTSAGWVTFNSVTPFTMKVYYEKHPETYVIYTCSVDNFAPKVSVSYQKSEYALSELDEISARWKDNAFTEGDNLFIPSFIGFRDDEHTASTMYVMNGERVQSKYYRVQVSDESGVKSVQIYLDGALILTEDSDFNNIYLSRRGKYEIVATDSFGNTSTFTFTNESYDYVEYLVDGEEFSTDVSFINYFVDGVYSKVEYGNSQAEIRLSASAQVHYLITEENGKQHYFAFVISDGAAYVFKYVVTVTDGEHGLQIESISKQEDVALAVGEIARIPDLGVAIFLEKDLDQTISLVVRSVDDRQKTYTVEARISTDKNEMPYYFKTSISSVPSSLTFINAQGEALENGAIMKTNEAFKVKNSFDENVQSVEVAYSQTGNYKNYEMIFDGVSYRDVSFEDEGMYHVRVLNRYGVQTDYYILLSAQFIATATVEYTDGTIVEYSTAYTTQHGEFYSNKSVEFILYATNVTVLEKSEEISLSTSAQGYTTIYVEKSGSYSLKLEDEYGNVFEKTIFIKAENLVLSDGVLTNFSENALENYTHENVFIHKDVAISGNGIAFISMAYGEQTITLYDELHEEKTSFVEDCFVGSFGDGEYVLVFRDRYGNKAERTVHYCATPTLTILRKTLNGVGTESYPVEKALQEGVWTNDSVRLVVSASHYSLKVDGLENVLSISYDSKTKNEYSVHYQDEYGFVFDFKVHLLRETVEIAPSAEMKVLQISDLLVTKDSVQVEFSKNALCTYVWNNAEEQPYQAGEVLYKDGVYRFKAVDKAGNVSTYVVKKDSAVEYHFEDDRSTQALINGGVVNGKTVRFYVDNSDSAYIKKVFHNNELVKYDDKVFNERGKWEVIVADEVGNESYFRFYILYGNTSGFTYTVPYDYQIISVVWQLENSSALATDTIKDSGKLLEATDNGKYTVTMQSTVTGDIQTFTFTIDKTPPKVELVGCEENEKTINNVTIKGCSVGDTIYVYKGSKLVKTVYMASEFTDPPTIKEGGKYTIVVENEAGIRTELRFERKHIPNAAGSVLIITISLALVGGLLLGLIWRNHSKTDD